MVGGDSGDAEDPQQQQPSAANEVTLAADEPSIVFQAPNKLKPLGLRPMQKSNDIGDLAENSADGDSGEGAPQIPATRGRHQQQQQQGWQRHAANAKRKQYTSSTNYWPAPRPNTYDDSADSGQQDGLTIVDSLAVDPSQDEYPIIDQQQQQARRNLYIPPPNYNAYNQARFQQHDSYSHWPRSGRGRQTIQPSELEEPNSLDEHNNYQQYPSLYEDNFNNQIQNVRRPSNARARPNLIQRPRFKDEEQQTFANGKLACGDCQSASRKLSNKQFCHLDFAIKAKLLSRNMAEDWTRFEVEIQDVYKSFGNAIELNQISTSSENKTADPAHHNRIKVGSVQTIWLPTEDLACKCPKLKLGLTYLLMGKCTSPI